MPTIRVDDEVYAFLQGQAEAFIDTPNSVLRRLFGMGDSARTATPAPPSQSGPRGKVATLVEEGWLDDGDALKWKRRQRGETHHARVAQGGRIQLSDGRVFDSPSGAARALAGYEVNGLRMWCHERDGRTLEELWAIREKEVGRGRKRGPND